MSRKWFVIVTALFLIGSATAQRIERKTAPPTSAASGKEMYDAYCASCHGTDGRGSGPAATALKNVPTDLTKLTKSHGGTYPVLKVQHVILGDSAPFAHGSRDMPVWGPVFRALSESHDSEIHLRVVNLARYIQSLQQQD